MKTRNVDLLQELLTEQMNHWLLMPGALTIMGLSVRYSGHAGSSIGLWILYGLFPPLFFLLRSRFIGFFMLLFLHLAAASPIPIVLYLQGRTVQFYICVACIVGYVVHSLIIYLNEDKPYTKPLHPIAGILLSAGSIMLLRHQNIRGWDLYFIVPLVVALALYALTLYIRQYLEFLAINEKSAGHLPAAEMFRSGFMLVAGFVLIGAVVLLLCANVGNYSNLWAAIKSRIVHFLRYLFSPRQQSEPEQSIPLTEAEMPVLDLPPQTGQMNEPSLISRVLVIASYVIVACFLAFCMVASFFRLILFLRLRFSQRRRSIKTKPEEEPELDVREKCGVERISTKRKRIAEILSPAQRIRRLYKKRILTSAQELTDGNLHKLRIFTPKECGQRLEEEQMAQIYEQVRYSDREATVDTLRRMKSALRHRGHPSE